MRKLLLVLLVLSALVWLWGLRRAGTLFTLKIREGRVVSSHGSLPPRLLSDLVDVIERGGLINGTVRAVSRGGAPVLLFDGELSPAAAQQMRNVVGQFTVAQIRSGKRH